MITRLKWLNHTLTSYGNNRVAAARIKWKQYVVGLTSYTPPLRHGHL